MKTKISILAVVMCFLFSSCETNVKEFKTNNEYLGSGFVILEIDSCEYIMASNDLRSITHKGNCKYCKERLLKLFK